LALYLLFSFLLQCDYDKAQDMRRVHHAIVMNIQRDIKMCKEKETGAKNRLIVERKANSDNDVPYSKWIILPNESYKWDFIL